ncbi:hypothetical protein [Nocardia nepalensis]|uniref:hypothetical protein n=1 Tax=Nocardia nepalensis TaxID=3375448 RepID=UPI003B679FA7
MIADFGGAGHRAMECLVTGQRGCEGIDVDSEDLSGIELVEVGSQISRSDVPLSQGAVSAAGRDGSDAVGGSSSGQIGLAGERAVEAVCSGLTVSFEVQYVGGVEGERVTAAQAKALAALLKWQADHCDVDRC